jgi:hypothetical protein
LKQHEVEVESLKVITRTAFEESKV